MASLSQLFVYPVKSIQGVPLHRSPVLFSGLEHDRRYMIIDENGEFVTGRKHPTLSLVHGLIQGTEVITLTHPTLNESITLRPSHFTDDYVDTSIWGDSVQGRLVGDFADDWFSELLQQSVKLVFFGDLSERFTSRCPDKPVAFADGYPFLLANEASLTELNRRALSPVDMRQFRPNLVVDAKEAFIEDSWKRIRIGDVEFENVKPCVRCVFTTLNADNATRSATGEPLKALSQFRRWEKHGVTFGVNLVALNEGTIEQGDEVEILEWRESEHYVDNFVQKAP